MDVGQPQAHARAPARPGLAGGLLLAIILVLSVTATVPVPVHAGDGTGWADLPPSVAQEPAEVQLPPPPVDALSLHRQALQVDPLRAMTGSDGAAVTVAIIDTGVDPGSDALSLTPDGAGKVTVWRDFTGQGSASERADGADSARAAEGDVLLAGAATAHEGQLLTRSGLLEVDEVPSQSGVYRFGYFEPPRSVLGSTPPGDRLFPILAADEGEAGRYDAVYIDVDRSGRFAAASRLRPYHVEPRLQAVGEPAARDGLAVVVTELTEDGRLVNLGFDANGHGTQVAALAAGYLPGQLVGMAPGAQVMALKALREDGEGRWASIADALRFAIDEGADVINISIGGVAETAQLLEEQSVFIQELLGGQDRLIVLAAGNTGPGLGSVRAPTASHHLLTVGAYISPAIWESHYGFRVPDDSLWIYSAVGPRGDAGLAPNLVAPGAAWSVTPSWSPVGTDFLEGTSVAAPLVSGGAALLLDAARRQGDNSIDVHAVRKALQRTARPLTGYLPVEQGYGVPQLLDAWQFLREGDLVVGGPEVLQARLAAEVPRPGLYARDWLPGGLVYRLENLTEDPLDLALTSQGWPDGTAGWFLPEADRLELAGISTRDVWVEYAPPVEPGIASGFLRLQAPGSLGPVDLLQTVIHPHALGPTSPSLQLAGELAPAARERHFIRVEPGTTRLTVSLRTPVSEEEATVTGRVQAFIIGPDGTTRGTLSFVGGPDDPAAAMEQLLRPAPGTWEVVVYASPALSRYDLEHALYELELEAAGVTVRLAGETYVDERTVQPGQDVVRLPVQFTAWGDPVTGTVRAGGLVQEAASFESFVVRLETYRPAGFWEFSLPENVLISQVVLRRTVGRNPVPVELRLFRVDPDTHQLVQLRGTEAPGTDDRVTLLRPEGGDYVAWVAVREPLRQALTTEFNLTFVRDADMVSVLGGRDLHLDQGSDPDGTGVQLIIRVPEEAGRYVGFAGFEDDAGDLLAVEPFYLQLGPPRFTIHAYGGGMAEQGGGRLTVIVQDGEAGPWHGTMEVNGRRYHVRHGGVVVPLEPEDGAYHASVAVPVGALGWQEVELVVPVGELVSVP